MPAPEEIIIPYSQWNGAKFWADFAAAALAGHNAYGFCDPDGTRFDNESDAAVRLAAGQADAMLIEFRARFHHAPEVKS